MRLSLNTKTPGSNASIAFSLIEVLVAVAIVVADMVGVGVFTSLGFQVKDIPSGFSILLLWTVGGVVALCGVFSYGELGAMFPRSSGEYNFLGRAFHPAFGFGVQFISGVLLLTDFFVPRDPRKATMCNCWIPSSCYTPATQPGGGRHGAQPAS